MTRMGGRLIGGIDLIPGVAVVVYEGRAVLRLGGVAVYTVGLEAFSEGATAKLMKIIEAGLAEAFGSDAGCLVALSLEPGLRTPFPRIVLETVDGHRLWDYTASGIPTADQLRKSFLLTRAMADGLEMGL